MCLALCGTIVGIGRCPPHRPEDGAADPDDPLWRSADVDFGGVRQQVSLACLPQARVGDRVLVHVGLAISLVEVPAPGDAPRSCTQPDPAGSGHGGRWLDERSPGG